MHWKSLFHFRWLNSYTAVDRKIKFVDLRHGARVSIITATVDAAGAFDPNVDVEQFN